MQRHSHSENNNEVPEVKLQLATAGPGGGNKIRTSVGQGGSGDAFGRGRGDALSWGSESYELKHLAIDALGGSNSKDWSSVYQCLLAEFSETDQAHNLADALATLVVSAYVVALYLPADDVEQKLGCMFEGLSHDHVSRLAALARNS